MRYWRGKAPPAAPASLPDLSMIHFYETSLTTIYLGLFYEGIYFHIETESVLNRLLIRFHS